MKTPKTNRLFVVKYTNIHTNFRINLPVKWQFPVSMEQLKILGLLTLEPLNFRTLAGILSTLVILETTNNSSNNLRTVE